MATTKRIFESTSGKVASSAGRVLAAKSSTSEEKTIAASALAQRNARDQTSAAVSKVASKILKSPDAAKSAKSLAASVLTQAPNKKR